MNRDKQFEEKRDLSDILYMSGYGLYRGDCNDISKQIYDQGYRKASEVAREIFAEIDSHFHIIGARSKEWYAELKKKYESEGEG